MEDGNRDISDSPILDAFEMIENNRKNATLGPVLLEEYAQLEGYGIPDQPIRDETNELLEYLDEIATRNPGEIVPLGYNGEFFEAYLALLGRQPHDVRFYLKRTAETLEEYHHVYILASGRYHVKQTKKVIDKLEGHPNVSEINPVEFTNPDDAFYDKGSQAICAKFVSAVRT